MSDEFADWSDDLDEDRDDEPDDFDADLDDDFDADRDDDFDEDLGDEPDDEAGELPESWEIEIDNDELEAALAEIVEVSCPYCGEEGEIAIDPVGGDTQEYVEDCEICCQPWSVRVMLDPEGGASVEIGTLDDV